MTVGSLVDGAIVEQGETAWVCEVKERTYGGVGECQNSTKRRRHILTPYAL